MCWDVTEVKPEPDFCLFVRFKDRLTGRVRLRREELTGVLEPLRNERFFERVFIDRGAVAWPGEIDLAPDAMYAQIASQCHEPQKAGPGKSPAERAGLSFLVRWHSGYNCTQPCSPNGIPARRG
jgi:hypothetical protein